MNSEIFASFSATNVFWQALCMPKMLIPATKTGIVRLTVSISFASAVKILA